MHKILNKYKFLIVPVCMTFMFLVCNTNIVSAVDLAGWYVVIDDTSNNLIGFTTEDKANSGGHKAEETISTGVETNCSQLQINPDKLDDGDVGSPSAPAGAKCVVQEAVNSNRTYLAWTWPPTQAVDADSKDFEMLEWVNSTLVDNFNMAAQKVIAENNLTFKYKHGFPKLLARLANDAYATAMSGSTSQHSYGVTGVNNKTLTYTYKMSAISSSDLTKNGFVVDGNGNVNGEPDWKVSDFIKLWVGSDSNEAVIVPYRVPKGYSEGQRLYQYHSKASIQPEKISWSHIAYQASYSKLKAGVDAQNTDEILNPSGFEKMINGMVRGIVNSVSSFIGLYSIEDLTLNRGIRSVTYYKGLMPRSFFNGASLIYWVFQIIGIFIIAGGFIKLMIEKNASIINPGKRLELMDSIQNLFLALGIMLLFIPFFTILATVNEIFVNTLSTLVSPDASLSMNLSNGSWVGIIIEVAFLFILFKINVTYIIRAVTIMVLYASAPWFISMLSTGEKGRSYFSIWIKELCINIFLQTFNAIMTVIFLVTLRYTNLKIVERFVILMAYIGLTDYFKNTLMDSKSGVDQVAGNATSALGTMSGTAFAGVLGGLANKVHGTDANGNKVSGKGEGSKGGFGSRNESTIVDNADNDQSKRLTRDNTPPERGFIGGPKQKIKDKLVVADKKISEGKKGKAYKGAKNAGKALGKIVKTPAKVGFDVASGMALAGTTLGMEAIGANSFEARRRLAQNTSSLIGDGASLINGDYFDELESAKTDWFDGDTSQNEVAITGKSLQQDAGIKSARISSVGVHNSKNNGSMSLDGTDSSSVFESGREAYTEMMFDESGAAYQQLNNNDNRAAALVGMNDMKERMSLLSGKDVKMEMITEKKGDNTTITGYRTTALDGAKIHSYGNGQKPSNKNGKGPALKAADKDYLMKNVPVIHANNYVAESVRQRKKGK